MSKNLYIDKLDNIVKEYNNTYQTTIKMKPIDVTSSTYTDFLVENNDKNPKFDADKYVGILKYKDIFAKGCSPSRPLQVFVIKKVKNAVLQTYVIEDLNREKKNRRV